MRALVTGASGALGQDVCALLEERGYDVLPIRGVNLGDTDAAREAIDALAESGRFHGVVNVAGGFAWETVMDGDVDTWDRMWSMNLKTTLNTCRAAIPHLEDGGSIVTIGAAAAARAAAGMGAYTASKSAVARLTEALSEELAVRRIRVNAVLPTIFDTPSNRRDMPDADVGEWLQPREVSNIVAFLLSEEASAITGASIATR